MEKESIELYAARKVVLTARSVFFRRLNGFMFTMSYRRYMKVWRDYCRILDAEERRRKSHE